MRDTVFAQLETWDAALDLESLMLTLPQAAAAAGAQVEDALGRLVRRAHALGATWGRIGEALGMARPSAWERFCGEE